MSSSKVYVLQEQRELNQSQGRLERKHDFTDAERFGQIIYCLPSNVSAYDMEDAVRMLHERMQDFKPGDFIVPVGAPALMAVFGAIAADKGEGSLNVLSWHNGRQCYIPIKADSVWPPDNAKEESNGTAQRA